MQRLYIYLLTHDVISVCLESEAFRLVYGGWSLGSYATAEPAAEAFALPVTSIVLRAVGETEDRAESLPPDLIGWQKLEWRTSGAGGEF